MEGSRSSATDVDDEQGFIEGHFDTTASMCLTKVSQLV